MPDPKLKVAVLFRGPTRPDVSSVVARVSEFMQQLDSVSNIEVTTYLATWRQWKDVAASELLAMDLFDNVLMQTQPSDAQIQRATLIKTVPSGQVIRAVYNMYYQVKTALDIIRTADDYHYIINTRTDMVMQLGQHLPQWFDSGAYTAPHVPGVFAPHAPHIPAAEMFMCDQFGIAPAAMMHAAWDYGSIADLGRRIEAVQLPEQVLENMIVERGIPVKSPAFAAWQLDPRRNA